MQHSTHPINYQQVVDDIAEHGFCVIDHFMPDTIISALARETALLQASSGLQQAGIGREQLAVNKAIRGDSIYWLNAQNATLAQQHYFMQMEQLRLSINQHLYLGLFGIECHLAYYPQGAFYKKHLDCFAAHNTGKPQRKLSCIVYLNPNWDKNDGGQLRLYLDPENQPLPHQSLYEDNFIDILPEAGKAVIFLSDVFYHEVLPATRERLSLTGWFFNRPSPANL